MMDSIGRRRLVMSGASLALAPLFGRHGAARAQQVATVTVGFPPGGTTDAVARLVATTLSGPDVNVVVENKPGGTGQIAVTSVVHAPPDGNRMLLTPSSIISLYPQMYRKVGYDPLKDLKPLAAVCDHAFGLAVSGTSPIRTLADFAAAAKANPAAANYAQGSGGSGTTLHFLGTLLGKEIGVPLINVPYKGVPPAIQDLIAGNVLCTINPFPTMIEMHKAGRLRILAVTNPKRVASLPDVPTFTELGMPSLELVEWYGLFTSAKVPDAVARTWQGRVQRALSDPRALATATSLEVALRSEGGDGLQKLLARDVSKWERLISQTGLTLDS